MASASTHHEGGPTHAVHDAADPHVVESAEEQASEVGASVNGLLSSALAAPARAWKSSNLEATLPSIGAPRGEYKPQDYKASDRPLDSNERKGVWALAGVLGLGLFAGGFGGKKDKANKGDHGKDGKSGGKGKGGAKGVSGDANWEKASGAEIVGHGSRKE